MTEAWDGAEASQTARSKGYSVDIAWRFADPRAAIAYEACRRLRGALGGETEISQLLAVARWAERFDRDAACLPRTRCGGSMAQSASSRRASRSFSRGSRGQRAAPVLFAGACNNACNGCENRDRFLPDDGEALRERVDEARGRGLPLMLAGREPTLHPDFVSLVGRARGADGRRVGVTSNGRRFAYARFTAEAVRAGLSDASVKVFAARPAEADAVARVDGAFRQAMTGIDNLVRAGVRVEIRVPLHARALATLPEFAALARAHGAGGHHASKWHWFPSASTPSRKRKPPCAPSPRRAEPPASISPHRRCPAGCGASTACRRRQATERCGAGTRCCGNRFRQFHVD